MVEHAILPALALLITTIGTWTLTMRNNIDHAGRGLRPDGASQGPATGRIMLDYAARNAVLPNLPASPCRWLHRRRRDTDRDVFNYPGVGYMLLQAVENEDYPLMQALFLLITVAVLGGGAAG